MIRNPEIITNLIKEGCPINLQRLEDIDLIISANQITTAEEYQQAMNYIEWHSKQSKKQGGWDIEISFNLYIKYLTKRQELLRRIVLDPQPKEDLYEILEVIRKAENKVKNKYERIIEEQIAIEIDENKKDLRINWWENL